MTSGPTMQATITYQRAKLALHYARLNGITGEVLRQCILTCNETLARLEFLQMIDRKNAAAAKVAREVCRACVPGNDIPHGQSGHTLSPYRGSRPVGEASTDDTGSANYMKRGY